MDDIDLLDEINSNLERIADAIIDLTDYLRERDEKGVK